MRSAVFSSLRSRLLLLVFLAIVPALALMLGTAAEQKRLGTREVRASAVRLARLSAAGQQRLIEGLHQALIVLSELPAVRARDPAACNTLFGELQDDLPTYVNLALLDRDGRLLASGVPFSTSHRFGDRSYFRGAVEHREFFGGDFEVDVLTGKPVVPYAFPILDASGRVVAVLRADLDLERVQRLASETPLPPSAALLVIDRLGTLVARIPHPEEWVRRPAVEASITREMLAGKAGAAEVRGVDDTLRIYAYAPIGGVRDVNLFLAIGIPKAPILAEADHIYNRTLLLMLLMGALALAAAWVLGDIMVLRRVRALLAATRRVSGGDLAARAGPPYRSGELDRLALAFDEMATTLEARRDEADRSAMALRGSETRKTAVLEAALDGIIAADETRRITEFNPAAERIFGFARADALGKDLVETIIPASQRERHREDLTHSMATGEGRRIEFTARRADGSELEVELAITAVSLGGSPLFVASVRDITDRKHDEQLIRQLNFELERRVVDRTAELETINRRLESEIAVRRRAEGLIRESQRELREYIDHMATLTAKVAPDGTLLLVNRVAELGIGMPREQLMSTNFLTGPWWTFDPSVQARVDQAFRRAVAGETVIYDEQIFVFGRVITINFGLVPVQDEGGRVSYVLAEGRDITMQKEIEDRLKQRTEELEAANRELEAFSYSVSHDLRAPLRALDGFSRILLDEHAAKLPPEAQSHLQRIRDNTRQMHVLISDLLSFSRLSRQPLKRSRIDPADLVYQVLEELRHERQGRKVEITVDGLLPCDADPQLLRQVFANLLSNALKYTRRREVAVIRVGCRHSSSRYAVYFVQDNGVGFDMRYADRLFGVFQRLHRAEEYEGTGVGLAIAQRVIYRHEGRIWAEAEVDKGATFYFTLGGRSTRD